MSVSERHVADLEQWSSKVTSSRTKRGVQTVVESITRPFCRPSHRAVAFVLDGVKRALGIQQRYRELLFTGSGGSGSGSGSGAAADVDASDNMSALQWKVSRNIASCRHPDPHPHPEPVPEPEPEPRPRTDMPRRH